MFRLFDTIDYEGQFGISFPKFFNRTDALFSTFVLGYGQREDALESAFGGWQDRFDDRAHLLNVATDDALV
jgi:hypothetical protein